jgi:hypothetical protein
MSPSSKLKLRAEKLQQNRTLPSLSLSFYPLIMAVIIPKTPQKTFWKFSKHLNVISFTATVDTPYAHMSVSRIEKPSKNRAVYIATCDRLSNSKHILFYRVINRPNTIPNIATNWNGTAWDEIYILPCKWRITFWQLASWCDQDNVTINDLISFYINSRLCKDDETYWGFNWQTKMLLHKLP